MNSGDSQPHPAVRLVPRDHKILTTFLPAFRMATHAALHRVYWAEAQIDAVKKWTLRMREAEYLAEAPMWNPAMSYFHLTRAGAQRLQLPLAYAHALTPTQLARAYGFLSFCLFGSRLYRKYSMAEFQREFPQLYSDHMENDCYYVDSDFQDGRWPAAKRIGYLYVDSGKRLRDVMLRCSKVLSQRNKHNTWYHQVMRAGRLVYAIVTPSSEKREQILDDLAAQRRDVPIRVEVRPDLFDAIPQRIARPPADPQEA